MSPRCICVPAFAPLHPCVHIPVLCCIPASCPRIAPCVDLRIAPASPRLIAADPCAGRACRGQHPAELLLLLSLRSPEAAFPAAAARALAQPALLLPCSVSRCLRQSGEEGKGLMWHLKQSEEREEITGHQENTFRTIHPCWYPAHHMRRIGKACCFQTVNTSAELIAGLPLKFQCDF